MNELNVLAILFIALLASGCSYGHTCFPVDPPTGKPYKLAVVQSDDFGSIWDLQAATDALDLVKSESAQGDTVVVLFIHGWHHNAKDDDDNLLNFQKTLEALDGNLRAQQQELGGPISVVGIYVGWRGRSLPSYLDYLTIWGRKPAAERVGSGDLSEFIARLQKIYEERRDDTDQNFMGLVLTGHSLGAQVLFRSVAPTLERALIQGTTPFAGTDVRPKTLALLPKAPPGPVSGIGDLTVLLNPAMEAYQFERFHRLYQERDYDADQDPILFVVSSENDCANAIAFPLSRFFSLPFRPMFRSEQQKDLFKNALGKYDPHRTHTLAPKPEGTPVTLCHNNATCLSREDLAGLVRATTAELAPISGRERTFSPVVVAQTSPLIVDGHNGIFLTPFITFLTEYVAEIEFKKYQRFWGRKQKAQALKQRMAAPAQ